MKIYVAPVGALSKKRKTGWNSVYHQNWWFCWCCVWITLLLVEFVCTRVSIVMSSIPFIWWVPNLPPCSRLFSCNRSLTRLFISILVSILGKRRKILFSIVAGSFSHITPGDWPKNSIKQSPTFHAGKGAWGKKKKKMKKEAGGRLMWENSKISSSAKHFFYNTENLLLLLIC